MSEERLRALYISTLKRFEIAIGIASPTAQSLLAHAFMLFQKEKWSINRGR
jgi:hypothetical protein